MNRRTFGGVLGSVICGVTAGCLFGGDSEPNARIALLELENHEEESHEFTVQIEAETVVFEETLRLGPAGSGDDATGFEDPVEPGRYTVRAHAAGSSATVEAGALVSDDEPCLRLRFYLANEILHAERQSYDRCE